MTLQYGKFPKFAKRTGKARPSPSKSFRVKLRGRHDLEQITFLLQTMVARLQDQGVDGIEECAIYFIPLNRAGDQMPLYDHAGKPLEKMEIGLPVTKRFIKAVSE